MSHAEVTVERLSPNEIPQAALVMSAGIAATPNSLALWGGDGEPQRARIEKAIRIIYLENPGGVTLAAKIGGRLVGAVHMVASPGCQLSTLESVRLLPKMIKLVRGRLLHAVRVNAIGMRLDPKRPHWHMGPIGVYPEMQGKGIGSRLIEEMCRFTDGQKSPGYLETDQPGIVQLVQRYGYEVIGEAEMLKVHNWCMWREAA